MPELRRATGAGAAGLVLPRDDGLRIRREAVGNLARSLLLFYVVAAGSMAGAVLVHEYAHYVAQEGWAVPDLRMAAGRSAAEEEILTVQRVQHDRQVVLASQPAETSIVLYPNMAMFALTIGLMPTSSYADEGVLAETFLRMPPEAFHSGDEVVLPRDVLAAPPAVAVLGLLGALAWLWVTRSVPARAVTWAYFCELGNNVHHLDALGLPSAQILGVATGLVAASIVLAVLRSQRLRDLSRPRLRWERAPPPRAPAGRAAGTRVWVEGLAPRGPRAPARVRSPDEIAWRPSPWAARGSSATGRTTLHAQVLPTRRPGLHGSQARAATH